MKLYTLTVLGHDLGFFVISPSEKATPAEAEHFDGYEYSCYHCGERLVRRADPLADRDLELLLEAHLCEVDGD